MLFLRSLRSRLSPYKGPMDIVYAYAYALLPLFWLLFKNKQKNFFRIFFFQSLYFIINNSFSHKNIGPIWRGLEYFIQYRKQTNTLKDYCKDVKQKQEIEEIWENWNILSKKANMFPLRFSIEEFDGPRIFVTVRNIFFQTDQKKRTFSCWYSKLRGKKS